MGTESTTQSPTAGVITVRCACGKVLKAPAALAGRKSRCPQCQAVLTIAAGGAPPPAPAAKLGTPVMKQVTPTAAGGPARVPPKPAQSVVAPPPKRVAPKLAAPTPAVAPPPPPAPRTTAKRHDDSGVPLKLADEDDDDDGLLAFADEPRPSRAKPPVDDPGQIGLRGGAPDLPPGARRVAPVVKPPPLSAARVEEDFGLYELAEAEKAAGPTAQAAADANRCPGCMGAMDAAAVVCLNCGFNRQSGKKLAMAGGAASPTAAALPVPGAATGPRMTRSGQLLLPKPGAQKVADAMAPQGSVWVGVGVCAAAVGVALILWVGVAAISPWILIGLVGVFGAPVVGIAAGLGMQVGQKGYSNAGGLIAAGFAIAGIVVGRVAVAIVISMVTSLAKDAGPVAAAAVKQATAENDIGGRDPMLIDYLTKQEMTARGLDIASGSGGAEAFDRYLAIRQEATARVKNMPEDEYQQLLATAREQQQRDELVMLMTMESGGGDTLELGRRQREARDTVAAMTPDQVQAELDRRQAPDPGNGPVAAAQQGQAGVTGTSAAGADDTDDEGGGSGLAIGGLISWVATGSVPGFRRRAFGWTVTGFLVTLGAIGLAYRTASGAQSD